jgi:hypothetical protein
MSICSLQAVLYSSQKAGHRVVNSHHLEIKFTQAQQAAAGGLLLSHSGFINYPSRLPFMVHQ